MAELHFESQEVEEYYKKQRRILGISHPCRWDYQEVITRECGELYQGRKEYPVLLTYRNRTKRNEIRKGVPGFPQPQHSFF